MKNIATSLSRATLLAGLLIAFAIPAPEASAAPEPGPGLIGLRLLEAPVARREDPRALKYIVDHLKPGTIISRRVEISNKTETGRHITLYPSAAEIAQNRFTFAEGRTPNELTDWISVDQAKRNLAPQTTSEAIVTIRVPKEVAPGERYAVLWAESSAPADTKHNIGSITRVGVRIYLDIEESAEYCDFKIEGLTAKRGKDGRPSVVAQVRNTGRRALDLKGILTLSDGPSAMNAGPFAVTPGTTLPPDGSGPVEVPLSSQIPKGPWKATLRLESGTVKRQATAGLTLPEPGSPPKALTLTPSNFGPWPGAALALACGAIIVGLVRFHRSRGDESTQH